MKEEAKDKGQEIGGMSRRTAAWLAWSLCALSLALTALSLFLLGLYLSHPNTHIYNPWLDNTLTAALHKKQPKVANICATRDSAQKIKAEYNRYCPWGERGARTL